MRRQSCWRLRRWSASVAPEQLRLQHDPTPSEIADSRHYFAGVAAEPVDADYNDGVTLAGAVEERRKAGTPACGTSPCTTGYAVHAQQHWPRLHRQHHRRLTTDADGSLTIYLPSDEPTNERSTNWLPAPPGPFNLTMRCYTPLAPVLDKTYVLPPVRRVEATPSHQIGVGRDQCSRF